MVGFYGKGEGGVRWRRRLRCSELCYGNFEDPVYSLPSSWFRSRKAVPYNVPDVRGSQEYVTVTHVSSHSQRKVHTLCHARVSTIQSYLLLCCYFVELG